MRENLLFNDKWKFKKVSIGTSEKEALSDNGWNHVDIPHDWLIYDSNNLYEDGEGWYKKDFDIAKEDDKSYALRFDGIYMDSTIYVNGVKAGEWKYGYSTFELEITEFLNNGTNSVVVKVVHCHPNSRWYSGAGIYRNVWFKIMPKVHMVSDGQYIRTLKNGKNFQVKVSTEAIGTDKSHKIYYYVLDAEGHTVATEDFIPNETEVINVTNPVLWEIDNPYLYTLVTEMEKDGYGVVDRITTKFGFRTIAFDKNNGFFLNGKHIKINGMCQHHDLGALGAAVNKDAIKRQLIKLKEMGANAIRTSHNMPAPELLELADEMGFLINLDMFDMWKIKKTEFDYARFFDEWVERDVDNCIRRDRNHPSVIMWSIGNEIYDTHANPEDGLLTTKRIMERVLLNDPEKNAYVTFASNFLEGESTQKCGDELGLVGYNYGERLYDIHHKKHPEWSIYGSETGSTLQSRGVYHFPYSQPTLTDIDEQCSGLGNCTTSWGAKSTEACIIKERDTEYSAGQFVWTGFDYIGEPTPYQTKNSYFGQIDTAGFEKDTFYIYQAEWTDYKKTPMIHLFPYWDFNEGEKIDIRIASNAPRVELFFNGISQGSFDIDHSHGTDLLAHYIIPYSEGILEAVAYDENGETIAQDVQKSFKDAKKVILSADKTVINANGLDMAFVEINMSDEDGNIVKNANNRVKVSVSGPGRLVGLDNGDSTDYDSYKGNERKLFSGRLLAMVAAKTTPGDIIVTVESEGIHSAAITIKSEAIQPILGVSADTTNFICEHKSDIPIRKIEIKSSNGTKLENGIKETELTAVLLPSNCTCHDVKWVAINEAGAETNIVDIEADGTKAIVKAKGDGKFNIRCFTNNDGPKVNVISQLDFIVEGLGAAYMNPYDFVSAALYSISNAKLSNAAEHGIATEKNRPSYIGFENVDFGEFGADKIDIPIFAFEQKDYKIEVWSGIPDEEESELICTGIYNKPVIWDEYQSEVFMLNKRIKGVHTICIKTEEFVNIKGFTFMKAQKGIALIHAAENNKIYGDAYQIDNLSVNGIGNNVSLEFNNMNFGSEGVKHITICGNSYTEVNTINIIFTTEEGNESRAMIEFTHTNAEEEKTFDIPQINGNIKVTFVFLPGSNFDFNWFKFS